MEKVNEIIILHKHLYIKHLRNFLKLFMISSRYSSGIFPIMLYSIYNSVM